MEQTHSVRLDSSQTKIPVHAVTHKYLADLVMTKADRLHLHIPMGTKPNILYFHYTYEKKNITQFPAGVSSRETTEVG